MLSEDLNRRAFNAFSGIAVTPAGALSLGVWAFLEPNFWFIAPDLFLWLLCLYSPKNYIKYFWITLISALAGASLYFLLNLFFFEDLKVILMATPFVNEGMISRINDILAANGLTGLLYQAFSFMSVKIWVHLAVERGIPFLVFISLTGISRALRFLIFSWVFSRIGIRYEGLLRKYFIPFVALFVIGFLGIIVIMESTLAAK
jgi:membrane protein YqaA with SNARE-associated domain